MAKILLDYFFKITTINPTPAASTAFLRQVCVVAKPKSGQEGNVGQLFECTSFTQVQARTDNPDIEQLFSAGMSKVFVLLANDLDLSEMLAEHGQEFFTLLVARGTGGFVDADVEVVEGDAAEKASITVGDITFEAVLAGVDGNDLSIELLDEVDDAGEEVAHLVGDKITVLMKDGASTADQIAAAIEESVSVSAVITATVAMGQGAVAQAAAAEDDFTGGLDATAVGLDVGSFTGVVGVASDDTDFLEDQAAIEKRCAFYEAGTVNAKNLMYAFGKLLSNTLDWKNQQFITMPLADDVDLLGDAEALFDDKISFVINDDEFGKRLALFCAGGKAITAPYILRNLEIDLQSQALQYVSANQPAYSLTQASLLEDELQKVIDGDGQEDGDPGYVGRGWITEGSVDVRLEQDNFVASGYIEVPTPRALWRIAGQLTQS